MHVTDTFTSKSKPSKSKRPNTYFDIHFKTSPTEQTTIRIMKNANPSLNRQYFIDKKEQPAKLSKLSVGDNVLFFNSCYGSILSEEKILPFSVDTIHLHTITEIKQKEQGIFNVKGLFTWNGKEELIEKKDGNKERLREGIIVDEDHNTLPVSIWGNTIDEMIEDQIFEFSNMEIKYYYGIQKLGATRMSRIRLMNELPFQVDKSKIEVVDWERIQREEKEIAHPTIVGSFVGCETDTYPTCISKPCKKRVTIPFGLDKFSCQSCGHRLISTKLHTGFVAKVDVEVDDEILELTCFNDVLIPFLGKNFVEEYKNEKLALEDKILDLPKMSITYSATKKVIESLEKI